MPDIVYLCVYKYVCVWIVLSELWYLTEHCMQPLERKPREEQVSKYFQSHYTWGGGVMDWTKDSGVIYRLGGLRQGHMSTQRSVGI